jgi:gliding motility-associated-like protein
MKQRSWPLLCCLILFGGSLHAQKQGNVWYFAGDAGLDFNNSPPTVLTDGLVYQGTEGCGTISSTEGKLLFYGNGEYVWNRKHEIMLNGDGLLGNFSSTNGAVIVPIPGENNRYYIFTTGGFQYDLEYGLRYSIVDMCGDNGYGEVVEESKNISILENAGEKLAFTKHANGVDYWLIAHEHFSTTFHAYLITETGISADVVSEIGTFHGRDGYLDAIGQMKISPDGARLALVMENRAPDVVDLFDFDITTGAITSFMDLSDGSMSYGVYGVAFSPDGSKLYIGGRDGIFQFALDAGTQEEIIQSKYKLAGQVTSGGLQLGPDGRIYVSRFEYVAVIESPNSAAPDCDFVDNAIYLDGNIITYAFPTFLDSFDYPDKGSVPFQADINDQFIICPGETNRLDATSMGDNVSYLWQNGSTSPVYDVSSPGEYTVTISDRFCTVEKTIKVTTIQSNDLGPDQSACLGEEVILSGNIAGATYTWQDGSSGSSFNVLQPGTFWVDATVDHCTVRDSVEVTFIEPPIFSFGGDKILCQGDAIELIINVTADSYEWGDGNPASSLEVSIPGTYVATATQEGCSYTDSVIIHYSLPPTIDLGEDTILLCQGDNFRIDLPPIYSYVWSDGSIDNFLDVTDEGRYWVTALSGSCSSSDTIHLMFTKCQLVMPNIFTPGGDGFNELFVPIEMSGIDAASIVIYNRWGTAIFDSNNFSISNGWDGSNQGIMANDGVYFWKVLFTTINGSSNEMKGTVTLRR